LHDLVGSLVQQPHLLSSWNFLSLAAARSARQLDLPAARTAPYRAPSPARTGKLSIIPRQRRRRNFPKMRLALGATAVTT
jgi:hypothetical protein